jgi:hypothetical protein
MNNDGNVVAQNTNSMSDNVFQVGNLNNVPGTASAPISDNVVQTGSLNKEAEIQNNSADLKAAGPEVKHNLEEELQTIGVKEVSDRPNVTIEHKKIGVDHSMPSVPVSSSSTPGTITFPMSEEEINYWQNHGKSDDSGKWLTWLLNKVIKVLGIS